MQSRLDSLLYFPLQRDASSFMKSQETRSLPSSLKTGFVANWCKPLEHWGSDSSNNRNEFLNVTLPIYEGEQNIVPRSQHAHLLHFYHYQRLSEHHAKRYMYDTEGPGIYWLHKANHVYITMTDWCKCEHNFKFGPDKTSETVLSQCAARAHCHGHTRSVVESDKLQPTRSIHNQSMFQTHTNNAHLRNKHNAYCAHDVRPLDSTIWDTLLIIDKKRHPIREKLTQDHMLLPCVRASHSFCAPSPLNAEAGG